MTAGLIVLLVIAFFVLLVIGRTVRIDPPGAGRRSSSASAATAARSSRGWRWWCRSSTGAAADRPARAGGLVPATARHHRGQPRGADRLGHLLPGDRRRGPASYEIANFIQAIEQLTVTTLRNVIGGMTLEQTLTSRDSINSELRIVLDEATGKWGIRVNRVELKAVDPPPSIQEAMEKQMRAERDRRAAILQAEGVEAVADPHRRGGEAERDPARGGPARVAAAATRRVRPRRSRRCSTRSTRAIPTRSCSRTSTCRCCREIAQGDANKVLGDPERDNARRSGTSGPRLDRERARWASAVGRALPDARRPHRRAR